MAFQKGKSGNPGGRSKEKAFTDALRIAVNTELEPNKKKLRAIAERLVEEALNGESWAIQQVADRLDGKPAQDSTIAVEIYNALEMSDDELAGIAAGSGEGDPETPPDPQKLN